MQNRTTNSRQSAAKGDLHDVTTGIYDPWTHLAEFPGVWVRYAGDLPAGRVGVTNFRDRTVRLSRDLDSLQARCTLAHELVHLERGPSPKDVTPIEEAVVSLVAASRLIPIDDLAELAARIEAQGVLGVAVDLDVDEETVTAGLALLEASRTLAATMGAAA